MKNVILFALMGLAFVGAGEFQSWSFSLTILNLCLISAVMALGVNIQWGYAGIFNVGIMGFAALGGAAAVLVNAAPVPEAWAAGGVGILASGVALLAVIGLIVLIRKKLTGQLRRYATIAAVIGGFFAIREVYDPAVAAIESVDPAKTGFLGGLGLPIIFSWAVGGVFAAGGAWSLYCPCAAGPGASRVSRQCAATWRPGTA